jgi:hypothetical protein
MTHNSTSSFTEIDALRWPAMPNPFDRDSVDKVAWIWPRARIQAFEQVNPENVHGDGFLVFPFALAVFDGKKRHIMSVVLEQTDFRVLAHMTGERLTDLTDGMKGHLSPLVIAVYDADNHEEFGPYEGALKKDIVMEVLTEIVSEQLDLWEDPVRRKWDGVS